MTTPDVSIVDSHAHLFMSGTPDPASRRHQLNASFEDLKEGMKSHLLMQLAHGVVALRDGGDYGGHASRYKRECLPGDGLPVVVNVAGKAWHAPGRYGSLIGRTPLEGHTLARSVLKQQDGVEHIKIVNSGLNSLTVFGKETQPQFDLLELKEAVRSGRDVGLKTMVHANGRLPVRMAIEAGCHSIEHGYFMGEENLVRMAGGGVTWVPTAFTMEAYTRMLGPGIPAALTAKKTLYDQLKQMRQAAQLGVPTAVGTDSGSLGVNHGRAMREEVKLFISAGFSVQRAIQCATANGADLLGLENELGRIVSGMPATFVAAGGGPDSLPDALSSPKGVYVKGRKVF